MLVQRPATTVLHDDIEAMVKFYDPAKGFGFVTLVDGSEAYLPAAVVAATRRTAINSGTVVFCAVIAGRRGPEVSAVHYVDDGESDRFIGV